MVLKRQYHSVVKRQCAETSAFLPFTVANLRFQLSC